MPASRANRPRRKAKQDRSRETVTIILEAAARVLLDQGYALATTNRIAKKAGVSVGTLYEYFANKEEVFEALIQNELGHLVDAFRNEETNPTAAVDETISQLLLAGMSAMRFGPEFFRALEQVPNATFRRHLAEARQLVLRLIEQLLEDHRTELRVTDLELAAFVAVSAAEGIAANATSEFFDERLAQEIAVLLKVYLTGKETDGTLAAHAETGLN
jgi:AcrR family transcriptional regulator